jgi:hypothetical protein
MRVRMTLLYTMFFGLLHQSENVTPVCKFFWVFYIFTDASWPIVQHCLWPGEINCDLFGQWIWPQSINNIGAYLTKLVEVCQIVNSAEFCDSLSGGFCMSTMMLIPLYSILFNNSAANVELLVAIPSLPALSPLCLPFPFILSFWTFFYCISQLSFFCNGGESMPWRLLCLFLFASESTKLTALAPL